MESDAVRRSEPDIRACLVCRNVSEGMGIGRASICASACLSVAASSPRRGVQDSCDGGVYVDNRIGMSRRDEQFDR